MQFFPKGSKVILRSRSCTGKTLLIPVIVVYPGTDRDFAQVAMVEGGKTVQVSPTRLQPA